MGEPVVGEVSMGYALVTVVATMVDSVVNDNVCVDDLTVVAVDATNVVTSDGLEPVEIDAVVYDRVALLLNDAVVSVRYVVIAPVL